MNLIKNTELDLSEFEFCERDDFGVHLFNDFASNIFPILSKDLGFDSFSAFCEEVDNKFALLGNIFVKHCSSFDTLIVFLFMVIPMDVVYDCEFIRYKIHKEKVFESISSALQKKSK